MFRFQQKERLCFRLMPEAVTTKRFYKNASTCYCLLKRFPEGNAQTGDCLRSKQLSKQFRQLHDVLAFVSTYGGRSTDIIYKAEGRINNQRKKPWFL